MKAQSNYDMEAEREYLEWLAQRDEARIRAAQARQRPASSPIPYLIIGFLCMIILIAVAVVNFRPDLIFGARTLPTLPTASGAVGRQAPPAAVRRAPVATPIPGLAQTQEDADRMYQEAIQAGEQQAQPATAPLPLNSAGEPVISQEQQQQMQQALNVALDEGMTAADQQLAAQREAAYAEQANRAPDVSKEDAEQMMHRDLCHVPRADPHTCATGLYKPTPVN